MVVSVSVCVQHCVDIGYGMALYKFCIIIIFTFFEASEAQKTPKILLLVTFVKYV